MSPLHILMFLLAWPTPARPAPNPTAPPLLPLTNLTDSTLLHSLVLPELAQADTPMQYSGFTLLYSEEHEQARWVAYVLDMSKPYKVAERGNRFYVDTNIKTGSANPADYKNSGFDRGHLAPAADMSWSETSMRESFFFSNMSPQRPDFNRGIWNKLEQQVRNWAHTHQRLYVVTGPVLHPGLPSIGPNKVSVPTYYYKALLVYTDSLVQGIGFILPNQKGEHPIIKYAVSIDSVEQISGINFYPQLTTLGADSVEAQLCLPCWFPH